MIKNSFLYILLLISITSMHCSPSQKGTANSHSLKEVFKNDFLIGTALNVPQIMEADPKAAALIPQQFSAVTPENIMKCEVIHPQWNVYDFNMADKYVAYGQKHHLFIVGHTLIWHSQLSPFVRNMQSADSLMQFMVNHINTVAGRYAGKINSWDVVNEALNEDGSLRKSIFLEKLGPDYIRKAFELAAKATPGTDLYYNDYNIEQPGKRAGAIALIKKLQESGVRIDGVGIQGHWHLGQVPFKDIEQSITDFAVLGIKVAITELDINVLPRPNNMSGADVSQNYAADPKMNPYPNGLPEAVQQQLANDYEQLFKIFLKHHDKISRITFWGVNDGQSWLNDWPIKGRTNYPLLFDRAFTPKEAYFKIIALKQNQH